MGQECFNCKKEMGRMSVKLKPSDLTFKNIPIPSGMTDDDRFCNDCYNQGKKDSKNLKKVDKIAYEEIKKGQQTEFTKQFQELKARTPEYKKHWDKGGIIQFKNERIAILHRAWGSQVEFIIAYDDVTAEGYRLMAIDEGKEASAGGISGGVSAYFYFQKMDFVK